jgi:WD40 repeat protein
MASRWKHGTLALLAVIACSGGTQSTTPIPRETCTPEERSVAETERLRTAGYLNRALAAARAADDGCSNEDTRRAIALLLTDLGIDDETLAAHPPAKDATDDERARAVALYRDGVNLRLSGAYDDSVRQLRRSYGLSPHPLTIVQIGLGHEAAGRTVEARKAFARALAIAEYIAGSTAVAKVRSGHAGTIDHLLYSPDARLIATAADDGAVKLWDVASGRVVHSLEGEREKIGPLAFDPTGDLVAFGRGGIVEVWSTRTGQQRAEIEAHTERLRAVGFSSDGSLVASAGRGAALRLWSSSTFELVREITLEGPVFGMSFRPNSTHLAVANSERAVVYDTSSGAAIADWSHAENPWTSAVAYSPDGTSLAIGGRRAMIVNASTGALIHDLPTKGTTTHLAYDAAGAVLVAHTGGATYVWDAQSGAELGAKSIGDGSNRSMSLRPDGSELAVIAPGALKAEVYDVRSLQLDRTLGRQAGGIESVACDASGTLIVAGDTDGALVTWNLRSEDVAIVRNHGEQIKTVSIDADDGHVTATGRRAANVWSTAGDALDSFGATTKHAYVGAAAARPGHAHVAIAAARLHMRGIDDHSDVWARPLPMAVRAMAFSPDGGTLVLGGADLVIVDASTGDTVHTIEVGNSHVRAVATSSDGSLVAGGYEGGVVVVERATGEVRYTLTDHAERVYGVAFAGDMVLSSSVDKTLRTYDAASGSPRSTFDFGIEVLGLASNADATITISARVDGMLELIDATSGETLVSLTANLDGRWVAIAPDGRVHGSPGRNGGASLLYWQVGELQLPGFVGWQRAEDAALLEQLATR